MYILEWITQYIKGKKYKTNTPKYTSNDSDEISNPDECNHFFMPLDSSKEYFSCKYCGFIISKKDLEHN